MPTQIRVNEGELGKLPDGSNCISKRSNTDCYIDRPNASFCNRSILDSFCLAEFYACYTSAYKASEKTSDENETKFLQGSLVELNHEGFANPKLIKLMSCNEKLKCWKIRRILRYRVPNNVRFWEKYANQLLLLFYPFRHENNLLSCSCNLY